MSVEDVARGIASVVNQVEAHAMCSPEECASVMVAAAAAVVIGNRELGRDPAYLRERFIARCAVLYDQAERATRDGALVVVPHGAIG